MKFIDIKGKPGKPGGLLGAEHLTINLPGWPGFAKF